MEYGIANATLYFGSRIELGLLSFKFLQLTEKFPRVCEFGNFK
jgi:hypothetical protein